MAEALSLADRLMIALAIRRACAGMVDLERNAAEITRLREILPQVNSSNPRLKALAAACTDLAEASGLTSSKEFNAVIALQNSVCRLRLAVEDYFIRTGVELDEALQAQVAA